MQQVKTIAVYVGGSIILLALVYLQIRIIHDCGIIRLMFGAAEWQWFFGYCY